MGAYKDWEFKDITACEPPKVEQSEEEKKEVETKFEQITKKIKDWIPDLNNNIKPMINGIQTPSYKFPSIQKCKESINKELGHEWNWN